MSLVTTHVLDTVTGLPAAGMPVVLSGDGVRAEGVTDADGRLRDLGPDRLDPCTYRITFATWEWFLGAGRESFYPEVVVTFAYSGAGHVHVPILLSPFSYTTYRGS